jgi:hypothetical protein
MCKYTSCDSNRKQKPEKRRRAHMFIAFLLPWLLVVHTSLSFAVLRRISKQSDKRTRGQYLYRRARNRLFVNNVWREKKSHTYRARLNLNRLIRMVIKLWTNDSLIEFWPLSYQIRVEWKYCISKTNTCVPSQPWENIFKEHKSTLIENNCKLVSSPPWKFNIWWIIILFKVKLWEVGVVDNF